MNHFFFVLGQTLEKWQQKSKWKGKNKYEGPFVEINGPHGAKKACRVVF